MANRKAIKTKLTKSALVKEIATYIPKGTTDPVRVTKAVLEGLADVMERSIRPGSLGQFMLPGLVKISTKIKPAVKKGTLVRRPGSSEMVPSKGRPKSMRVKARALTRLQKAAQK